jgi:hypothetical protein
MKLGVIVMWPFTSRGCKYKTLSHAVRAGDIRATRKMLNQGADPNKVDPNDDLHPLFYALNHGPEIVQLLIYHGADVNIPSPRRLHVMPLAIAEARGHTEIAAILRKEGARLRTEKDQFIMDPRLRLELEYRIMMLVLAEKTDFPEKSAEHIANQVEKKLNRNFPPNLPPQVHREVRALTMFFAERGRHPDASDQDIIREYLPFEKEPVPEKAMYRTGISKDQHVPRTHENLPSMVMIPVNKGFTYSHLVKSIIDQAPDKELVCLVDWGWTISQEDASRQIGLLYEFADDPQLVVMRFIAPDTEQQQIIVRASFMRETVSQVAVSNLLDLTECLSDLARKKGFHTTTK